MQISLANAHEIVNEIGRLVHQNINLMDESGTIIASTDSSRVGQRHDGARIIIEQHLPEYTITPEKQTVTERLGLNLPIEYEDKIVGVIGITGTYEEIIGYGQIVKKMTEILIRENSEMEQQKLDLRIRSRFLEDWVLGDGLSNTMALAERGLAQGIDITLPRRIIVVSARGLEKYTDTLPGQQMLERVERVVDDTLRALCPGGIILRNTARQIVLLPQRTTSELKKLAGRLVAAAQEHCDVRLLVGIGGQTSDLHAAYLEANRAWRGAWRHADGVLSYSEIRTELFLDDIPRRRKAEYLRRVFPQCTVTQVRNWVGLLEAYFAAEGSLVTAADALYIHKNTLQYRIKSLSDLSGLDVRRPSQSAALFMAIQFFHDIEDIENELSYLEV